MRYGWVVRVVFLGGVLLAAILGAVVQREDCEERGGDYVRGMFWFECVGEDEP